MKVQESYTTTENSGGILTIIVVSIGASCTCLLVTICGACVVILKAKNKSQIYCKLVSFLSFLTACILEVTDCYLEHYFSHVMLKYKQQIARYKNMLRNW